MKPIYSNFDGLDISFQCALPDKVLDELAEAKKLAQETRSDAVAKIGNSGRIVLVGETGSRGGQTARYFRIGSMPNRQVVLYDKISDITEKRKSYWWDFWGIKKSEFKGQIWRVEARAGKKELNHWNLRRFSDFEKMIGDVFSSILQDIKYTIPSETDKNISRWPLADFWQEAISIAKKRLEKHISHAERKMILEGIREQIKNQYEKSILGQTVSYAALVGMDISEIPAVLDTLGDSLIEQITKNQKKFSEKHQKASEKFNLLK